MVEEEQAPADLLDTPAALRRSGGSGEAVPTRPGEATPAKPSSRTSTAKTPSKMGGKLRRCGHTLSFVPWLALLSNGLLVAGLAVFAIKGPAAADAATSLLEAVDGHTSSGFPLYMHVFECSVWATVGVAGAAIFLVLVAGAVRLDQKLRKAGKYGRPKGSYGPFLFRFYGFLSWLGLVLTVLLALWSVVLGLLLTSWAAQAWNLQKGAATSAATISSLDSLGAQYAQALDSFAATIMGSAGVSATSVLPAADVPAPAPSPLAADPAAPAPAVSGTGSRRLLATAASLNATLTAGISALKRYAGNFTSTSTTLPVWQEDGICPSAACLNMALYPFTESPACVCTAASVETVSDLADSASTAALWAAIGVAGLFCGALFGGMELSKDVVLLSADQLFLKVIRRRSTRQRTSSSGSRSFKAEEVAAGYQVASPPPTSPLRNTYSIVART